MIGRCGRADPDGMASTPDEAWMGSWLGIGRITTTCDGAEEGIDGKVDAAEGTILPEGW
jgi:hypothetical protein